jgi:aspartate aminotransferase-like enzyme
VARRCGKQAVGYQVEWGQALDPDALRKELSKGGYDAVTLIHNETSTGVMNPLPEIMAVLREFPDVISIVDTVSSFSAVPIPKDELGIDVLITGTQKALALPPGLSLLSVSKRALDRAKTVEGRGYYFDFLEFQANHEKSMTPSTPAIPLIFGLQYKLKQFEAEGLENRYARHVRTNEMLRAWVKKHGMELTPRGTLRVAQPHLRQTPTGKDSRISDKRTTERFNCVINTGNGSTRAIPSASQHGDETEQTIGQLVKDLDAVMLSQIRDGVWCLVLRGLAIG